MKVLIFFIGSFFFVKTSLGQTGKFTYQYHNSVIKVGKFTFESPDTSLTFEIEASAGYLVGANNPYYQATKNIGPIPNGTWEIYAIKSEAKFTLRLRPKDDVIITERDGFLIHGVGTDKTPEESSHGCIIISDRESRKKLVQAFKKYGVIKISVTNIITSGGVEG